MKYIKLITQTAVEATASDNKQAERSAKAQLSLAIATAEQQLIDKEQAVLNLKRSRQFNPEQIYQAQSAVDLLLRKIEGFQKLLTELF